MSASRSPSRKHERDEETEPVPDKEEAHHITKEEAVDQPEAPPSTAKEQAQRFVDKETALLRAHQAEFEKHVKALRSQFTERLHSFLEEEADRLEDALETGNLWAALDDPEAIKDIRDRGTMYATKLNTKYRSIRGLQNQRNDIAMQAGALAQEVANIIKQIVALRNAGDAILIKIQQGDSAGRTEYLTRIDPGFKALYQLLQMRLDQWGVDQTAVAKVDQYIAANKSNSAKARVKKELDALDMDMSVTESDEDDDICEEETSGEDSSEDD